MQRRVLRGAFVGFGNVVVGGHLPGWQSRNDVTIVAATDVVAARREAFFATSPDGRWYDTLDDLLASETLDFVDICTPPGSHAALIQQVLDARLHVLCEKPLVTRADDALVVAAAAASADRIVHTVPNWLETPICLRILAVIAGGAIRALRSRLPALAAETGESIRQWQAAASCSTTVGTRFIASCAGSVVLRAASPRRSKPAASTNGRSKTQRSSPWTSPRAVPTYISPGLPTNAPIISRSRASEAACMLLATVLSSNAHRANAAGPVRRLCQKDRITPTGSP